MRIEKAYHSKIAIGPGGKRCHCCAPPPNELKRLQRRKARREADRDARRFEAEEAKDDLDNG